MIQNNANIELSIDQFASFGAIRYDRIFANSDIHCGDLKCLSIYGPASSQIQRMINDGIEAATLAPLASPTFTGTVTVD